MSDAELRKELVSRGFAAKDLKSLDTEALIKQIEEDDAAESSEDGEVEETAPEVATPKPKDKKMAGKVHIVKAIGEKEFEYIRTYNEEDHGEDYAELAKGFVEKNSARGFDTYEKEIPTVSVSFREYDKEKKAQTDRTRVFSDLAEGLAFKNSIPKASITFRA